MDVGSLRPMTMDTFPDLGSLSDQELKDLIQQLTDILAGRAGSGEEQ